MPPDNRYSILLRFHYGCLTILLQFQSHLKYMRVRTVQRCSLLKLIEYMWFTYLHEMLGDWYFFLISEIQLAPSDSKFPCMCQSIEMNKHIYIYIYIYYICPSVRPSSRRPNIIMSVSFTILVESISNLCILSANFGRCVACQFLFLSKFQNLEFFQMFYLMT